MTERARRHRGRCSWDTLKISTDHCDYRARLVEIREPEDRFFITPSHSVAVNFHNSDSPKTHEVALRAPDLIHFSHPTDDAWWRMQKKRIYWENNKKTWIMCQWILFKELRVCAVGIFFVLSIWPKKQFDWAFNQAVSTLQACLTHMYLCMIISFDGYEKS